MRFTCCSVFKTTQLCMSGRPSYLWLSKVILHWKDGCAPISIIQSNIHDYNDSCQFHNNPIVFIITRSFGFIFIISVIRFILLQAGIEIKISIFKWLNVLTVFCAAGVWHVCRDTLNLLVFIAVAIHTGLLMLPQFSVSFVCWDYFCVVIL